MHTSEGSNVIIANPRGQILLFLRDDKPDIPCPNMWALLGGTREVGETPLQTLLREIEEEIGVVLDPVQVTHHVTRLRHWGLLEHTYRTILDLDLGTTVLTEGQKLGWFTAAEIAEIADTTLGFEEGEMLADYFVGKGGE